ncbi:MAG: hypothetical protein K0B52_02295 [FCB group bacterium]|nr:hypothetical protein [FCB group bacterium]
MNNTAFRDKSMSPLMYTGNGLSGGISFEHGSEKRTEMFLLSFELAGTGNAYGNTCDYSAFAFKNYNFYHKNRSRQHRIVAGWSNYNYFNYYVNENYGNFSERSNYLTTFGPAAAYRYRFALFGREMVFDMLFDIQVLGFYLRPSYVSNNPEGYLDPGNSGFMAWLRSIGAFLPHQARYAALSPKITYFFRSGNGLSLNYQYEYLHIDRPEPFTQSSGKWYLTLMATL